MLLFFLSSLHASTVSKVVGVAGDKILTSRQVTAQVIFTSLYKGVDQPNYFLPLDDRALLSATSNQLMEFLIVEEAKSFGLASLSSDEIKSSIYRFKQRLKKSKYQKAWQALAISDKELLEMATQKLRSDKFLKLKVDTFGISISDDDVAKEYELRKSQLKDKQKLTILKKIREDLRQEKIQAAVREWFQVLRSKYVVKNLLIKS